MGVEEVVEEVVAEVEAHQLQPRVHINDVLPCPSECINTQSPGRPRTRSISLRESRQQHRQPV